MVLTVIICGQNLSAQTILEGYTFEVNNRGYLQQVRVSVHKLPGNILQGEWDTDTVGRFTALLPKGRYKITCRKEPFVEHLDTVELKDEPVYVKLEMHRKPGYLFDATLADAREHPDQIVDAIPGATIEIYNRTTKKTEQVLPRHEFAFFRQYFEPGNHYTMMIRKPGYLAKRIEVYVNIEGCILCVDGVRSLTPGVTENLTNNNTMGTLLANIELEKAALEKKIEIQNIYYDYDKWDIRPDAAERLDVAVELLKDNPGLSVELGSHTDARGSDAYNQTLSQKRAESAVAYIISEGVESARITAKGYGESQLANRCRNRVVCSEEEHQKNRRTVLRITGILFDSLEDRRYKPLSQIIQEEEASGTVRIKGKKRSTQKNENYYIDGVKVSKEAAKTSAPPAEKPAKMVMAVPPAFDSDNKDALKYQPKPFPTDFEGFTVEVMRVKKALVPGKDSLLERITPMMLRYEAADKRYSYYIGSFETMEQIREFYNKTALPLFPKARVVRFTKGKKTYIE